MLIGFVGDLHLDRESPLEAFEKAGTLLAGPDVLLGNLEGPCCDHPIIPPDAFPMISNASTLDVYSKVGFNVLSLANNHIVDAGHGALIENRTRLNAAGIATCGAGSNLLEARHPARVTAGTQRVGILAYCSVFPRAYEATSDRPGIAPLKAYNRYCDIVENYSLPGYCPRIETDPDPIDHQNLVDDIAALRKDIDVLVVSIHWGDSQRPHVLSDHELRAARLCIDSGADIVIGHHQHALRGIEWYKGRPIFYGLGHFALDFAWKPTGELKAQLEEIARRDPNSFEMFPREGWPLLPMHPDTRMTMMGWALLEQEGITEVGFVPCRLDQTGRVFAVDPRTIEGQEIVTYLDAGNRLHGLNGMLDSSGGRAIGGCQSVKVLPRHASGDSKAK